MQFLIVAAKIAKKRSIAAVLSQKIEKHLLLSNLRGSDCNRCITWCGRQDLNLHGCPPDPKSGASANSATSAFLSILHDFSKNCKSSARARESFPLRMV